MLKFPVWLKQSRILYVLAFMFFLLLCIAVVRVFLGPLEPLVPDKVYVVAFLLLMTSFTICAISLWSVKDGVFYKSIFWLVGFSVAICLVSSTYLSNHFGYIKRKALIHQLKIEIFPDLDKTELYDFKQLRKVSPTPIHDVRLVDKSVIDDERFRLVVKESYGIDVDKYYSDILYKIGFQEFEDQKFEDQESIEKIVRFVQNALIHDPFGQVPLAHPIVALEYGRARCTITNQFVLRSLLEKIGFNTRNLVLNQHVAVEVLLDDSWRTLDANMFNEILTGPEGKLPETTWLLKAPNFYTVDQYALDRPIFDWPVNGKGERVTGYLATQRTEDMGYPSYLYGAPIEFSPSRPRLLNENIRTLDENIELAWDRVYDRDLDLDSYIVELGTSYGGTEVGKYTTTSNRINISLTSPGKYYYRVRAVDGHVKKNPQTYYLASREGTIHWSNEAISLERPESIEQHRLVDRFVDSVNAQDFELIERDGTYTTLFNIKWKYGNAVRFVDLSDPYFMQCLPFPVRSISVQRYRKKIAFFDNGLSLVAFDIEVKKSGYGGVTPFPIVVVGNAVELIINPKLHRLELRLIDKKKKMGDVISSVDIADEYKVFNVRLYFEGTKLRGSINGASGNEMATFPFRLDGEYIDLLSNKNDQVDYVFANLSVGSVLDEH